MRDLAPLLGAIAAALLVIAAAIFGAGDRHLFSPPPEAVAEEFVRQLVTRRYDLATKYLSPDLRRSVGSDGLRTRYEPMRRSLGKIDDVDATVEFIEGARAGARAGIRGDDGTASLPMRLGQEYGLWVVSELPEPAVVSRGR